ncbi:MAG: DUF3311 domain-containing protein [Alphaproteobacteria bacterium]|nr:DUF3311 domain-containing protein [Alphaproteobacteria bacterium]
MHDGSGESRSGRWWYALLLVSFVAVLWVPFFNRVEPEIFGIPFFFWYQFLWVIISALITALVYLKTAPRTHHDPLKPRAANSTARTRSRS